MKKLLPSGGHLYPDSDDFEFESWPRVYLVSDVDAKLAQYAAADKARQERIAELEAAFKSSSLLSGEVIEERNRRIALLERTLREALDRLENHAPLTAAELRTVL